jgi:hypothetical protein
MEWVSRGLNIKSGSDGIGLTKEDAVRACVGTGGGGMNFNVYRWGHWRRRGKGREDVFRNLLFININ